MRKPLVVVCAAAAAVVLAGGVATAAYAGETPDGPGFSLPGWGWPDFGDEDDSGDWGWSAGSGGVDGAGADDGGPDGSLFGDSAGGGFSGDSAAGDGSGSGSAVGDGSTAGSAADDGSAVGDGSASGFAADRGSAPGFAADRGSAAGSGADGSAHGFAPGASAARGGSVSAGGGSASGGSHAAGSAANSGTPSRNRQLAPRGAARQRPATTLATSARRAVTAADVSSSPASPVQRQLLALMNQSRRGGGCDALSVDRRLIDAANEHAADMARRRYFAHESPNGDSAGDRVSEAGYRWKRYGENIARGADSAYEVWNGWMHSPEHRHNILDCRLHQMGIGLALSGDGTPYWVQDFATPMS